MKKLFLAILTLITFINNAHSMVLFDQYYGKAKELISATGYWDFSPIGRAKDGEYITVFSEFLNTANDAANLQIRYSLGDEQNFKKTKTDILLGCFSQTQEFSEWDILYPSIFSSPISIITLPESKITKKSQLKNYRGAFDKNEPYSDFTKQQIKNFNAKEYNNYYDMFKALYNNEIDYIFTNYYHGITQLAKEGVLDEFAISKQSIWDVPVFICVHPRTGLKTKILEFYTKYLRDEKAKQKTKENLIKIINDTKLEYSGINAPSFIEEKE